MYVDIEAFPLYGVVFNFIQTIYIPDIPELVMEFKPSSAFLQRLEIPLPDSKDLPPIEDDSSKPPYRYTKMIGMSILRTPNRRSTPG